MTGTKRGIVQRKCTLKVSMKVYKFVNSFNLVQVLEVGN